MAVEIANAIHAMCIFDGSGAGAFIANHGFASFVRNGAGDYDLTLDSPIDAVESLVMVQGTTLPMCLARVARPADETVHLDVENIATNAAADDTVYIIVFASPVTT